MIQHVNVFVIIVFVSSSSCLPISSDFDTASGDREVTRMRVDDGSPRPLRPPEKCGTRRATRSVEGEQAMKKLRQPRPSGVVSSGCWVGLTSSASTPVPPPGSERGVESNGDCLTAHASVVLFDVSRDRITVRFYEGFTCFIRRDHVLRVMCKHDAAVEKCRIGSDELRCGRCAWRVNHKMTHGQNPRPRDRLMIL